MSKNNLVYESYFKELIELFPSMNDYLGLKKYHSYKRFFENSLSPEHKLLQKNLYNKYLKIKLEDDNLSKIFRYNLEMSIKSLDYNMDLIPLNHSESVISYFVEMCSGLSVYEFKNKKDYKYFIEKTNYFVIFLDECMINMRIGIKKKYTLPKPLCKLLINQIEEILSSQSFYNKESLKIYSSFNREIKNILEPKLKELLLFLKKIYYPNCNPKIGMCNLPNGKKHYEFIVRNYTTLKRVNILEIHKYGISEVNRIHKEMNEIKNKYGFKKSLNEFNKFIKNNKEYKFKDSKELIDLYKKSQADIFKNVFQKKFDLKISHNYLIKEVPKFNQKFAPSAYYMPGNIEGTRKGTFYINTNSIKDMSKIEIESLSLHEGIPGHHLQLTYLIDNKYPMFLKTIDLTAYEEGWGLYCENLGEYKDLLSYYGKLDMEMMRAIRLVVDTGIHYYNWSFNKCLKFFKKYSFSDEDSIKSELNRYIADPGQALSYKIGEKVFLDLKRKNKNSEKDFHKKIFENGPLPLFLLKNI